MIGNQHMALISILALSAVVGANPGTANAQGPRLYKLNKDRAALTLKALPDWFGTDLLRAERATTEFVAKALRSVRESIAEDLALPEKEPHAANSTYQSGFRRQIVIKQKVQVVRSFFEDARPQIVADLLKGGDLSEEDTARIFKESAVAAAAKSRQPGFELDLQSGTIKFKGPIYVLGGAVVLNGVGIGSVAKAAARYYRACRKGTNDEIAKTAPSDRDEIFELVTKCVNGALARLEADIGEFLSDSDARAVAPENVD
jgi:hypothetical protein